MSATTYLVADMEARAGIEPLDRKLDRRAAMAAEYAELEAFRQQYNDRRKSNLAIRALQIRDEKNGKGEKTTEKLIEDMAHADPDYIAWLDDAALRLARREVLRADMDAIDMSIYRDQAILRAFAAEARL